MIVITLANILPVAGFITSYLNDAFGNTPIFECILNEGLLYFLGLFIFSMIITVKQFSSFFGKTY